MIEYILDSERTEKQKPLRLWLQRADNLICLRAGSDDGVGRNICFLTKDGTLELANGAHTDALEQAGLKFTREGQILLE